MSQFVRMLFFGVGTRRSQKQRHFKADLCLVPLGEGVGIEVGMWIMLRLLPCFLLLLLGV